MSQTVDRALTIIDFVAEQERELADVAAELGVHKSTALRLLQTLEGHGYVRHDARHHYRLGTRFFRLASLSLGALDIRAAAASHLRQLSDLTQQTVHLGAFDGNTVFYMDKHESVHAVRMYSRIGALAPLYCTGVAKAILAELPSKQQRMIAAQIDYEPHTERTLTTPSDLLRELKLSHERGYAVDEREHEEYIHCVAVPLKLGDQPITHAISISATTLTASWEQVLSFVPLLIQTAAAIRNDIT